MEKRYVIRKAVPSDRESIYGLFTEMMRSIFNTEDDYPYEEGKIEKFWNGEDVIYVAEDDGVVAFLSVEIYHEPQEYMYLDDLSVTQGYRNMGIGTELMLAAERYARKLRMPVIVFHVEKSNTRARRLYERLGYSIFRDEGHRYLMKKEMQD